MASNMLVVGYTVTREKWNVEKKTSSGGFVDTMAAGRRQQFDYCAPIEMIVRRA